MKLSNKQIELLNTINEKLEWGDIAKIAKSTQFSREYVRGVLNPFSVTYNDVIVTEAANLVGKREQGREKLLNKLQGTNV